MLTLADNKGNRIVEIFDNAYDKCLEYISSHLRPADFDECFALTAGSPHELVLDSWNKSIRKWMIFNAAGRPVAALGVSATDEDPTIGVLWLLGTPKLDKMKRFFISSSKPIIEDIKKDFKVLGNFVDSRYIKAVRWLKWCGFTIDDPAPYGALGLPFHRFYIIVGA